MVGNFPNDKHIYRTSFLFLDGDHTAWHQATCIMIKTHLLHRKYYGLCYNTALRMDEIKTAVWHWIFTLFFSLNKFSLIFNLEILAFIYMQSHKIPLSIAFNSGHDQLCDLLSSNYLCRFIIFFYSRVSNFNSFIKNENAEIN